MHPAQRNKVNFETMTEEEKKLFRLYGKLPTHKNVLMKVQKDRKYFDSGDYALSKAGVAPQSTVGTAIPNPENIPHASPPTQAGHPALATSTSGIIASSTSPIRESPLAPHSHRRTSSAERESKGEETDKPAATIEQAASEPEPVVEHENERDISAASS